MIFRILGMALIFATAFSGNAAESDHQVKARETALDLAGAFSNDGFKIRDGHWAGEIKQGEQALLAVNLYAGNQYWFSVGSDESAKKFALRLYDENGKPVSTENYEDSEKAAAGFSPTISGQYFVSIKPLEGAASTFCLVYSYK
ncbi:MAG: hypothetical protein ACR2HH_10660 [Chthoniobacterales bacterium]